MLLMLHLISINVYNSTSAPPGRGFSYIELWMVGMQIPILLGKDTIQNTKDHDRSYTLELKILCTICFL